MSQKLRILLVEDEDHLLDAIKLNLELEGYKVHAVKDGKTALKVFKEERFNLVILDVMLPEMDGFQVCETIRLENSEVPILFLTAKNTSEDRVMGLKKGADDYLTDKTIYFNSFELKQDDGVVVPLTKKETMLLKLLIERKNDAVSREQILETVWNCDVYPSTRTIDNFILTFRKYFEPDQKNPVYFHSIRGVGYKFTDVN